MPRFSHKVEHKTQGNGDEAQGSNRRRKKRGEARSRPISPSRLPFTHKFLSRERKRRLGTRRSRGLHKVGHIPLRANEYSRNPIIRTLKGNNPSRRGFQLSGSTESSILHVNIDSSLIFQNSVSIQESAN